MIYATALDLSRSALHQVARARQCTERAAEPIETWWQQLSDVQLLDPSPSILRGYSTAQLVGRMGDRGENSAGLVDSILGEKLNADPYTSWLRPLTPTEFDEVDILRGALKEPLFAVKKNGQSVPAPLLSDGTLRFAALAATFFQPDMPHTLLLEEIENGIFLQKS